MILQRCLAACHISKLIIQILSTTSPTFAVILSAVALILSRYLGLKQSSVKPEPCLDQDAIFNNRRASRTYKQYRSWGFQRILLQNALNQPNSILHHLSEFTVRDIFRKHRMPFVIVCPDTYHKCNCLVVKSWRNAKKLLCC